ncbi:MAG: hypothetical protein CM1200mP38_3060 [Dehalococcoidia bacterium]|nr:MAG: hypothetical protein CM1200mP38_3060 [Dehalococcoidia bacterium]
MEFIDIIPFIAIGAAIVSFLLRYLLYVRSWEMMKVMIGSDLLEMLLGKALLLS